MKINKSLINASIIGTLNQVSSLKDLAKLIVKKANTDSTVSMELQSVKAASFSVRQVTGNIVSNNVIMDLIKDSLKSIYDSNKSAWDEYVQEEYDFQFKKSFIDDTFISSTFTVSANGRIIYVEVDM